MIIRTKLLSCFGVGRLLDKLVKVVNRLGVTIDFLLADYVVATDDHSINLLIQLMHDRTAEEKTLAINLLKVLFADK